jgi:hypothetical protein
MTCTTPLTGSERYARVVLSAWERREFAELESALTQVSVTLPENSAVESERMELIRDLGRTLLIWHRTEQVENETSQDTTVALLLHLAKERRGEKRRLSCEGLADLKRALPAGA